MPLADPTQFTSTTPTVLYLGPSMFQSSTGVSPLPSSTSLISGQNNSWRHRYYDSYRPATKRIVSSDNRSLGLAAELEVVRYHSNKSLYWAKSSSNKASQGEALSTIDSARGHSEGHSSPPATSIYKKNPVSTGHQPEQLIEMSTKGRKGTSMSDRASSRRSSHTVDLDRRNESEAQSRGIYGTARSSTSNVLYLSGYELKRPGDDEAIDRSVKRRRDTEEGEEPVRESDNHNQCSQKPVPRAYNLQLHTEPAHHLSQEEFPEHPHGKDTLPQKPVKVVLPSRDGLREPHVPPAHSRQGDALPTPSGPKSKHPSLAPPRTGDHHLPPSSTPSNAPSLDETLATLEARMQAFEHEERATQQAHEEDLACRRGRQAEELTREMEEKIRQLKHDAEEARRAAVETLEEAHERRLAELRRR